MRAPRSSVLNVWSFVFEAAGGSLGRDTGEGCDGGAGAGLGENSEPLCGFWARFGAGVLKKAPGKGFCGVIGGRVGYDMVSSFALGSRSPVRRRRVSPDRERMSLYARKGGKKECEMRD